MVQLSPTVQATPSNYTRVHGGRATPHLEHFTNPGRGRVLVDQLQSEQGSRYYRKRNRNIIVQIDDDDELEPGDDFMWLTLGQLHALLIEGNRINLNARAVLSCIPYAGTAPAREATGARDAETFRSAVFESRLVRPSADDVRAARSWLVDVKTGFELDVRRVSLPALASAGWISDGTSIRHDSGRFFEVMGVSVSAQSREVDTWTQPMVRPTRDGVLAFVCQRRAGLLQFLVQARVEPGFIDSVELGATLQLSPGNYRRAADLPPLSDYLKCPDEWVRLRVMQSEDGGRFYHDEKEHLVIEVPPDEPVDAPPHYRWMTLGLLQALVARSYHVAVEARSLLACLG
jgi:oxidase EvaA